MRWFRLAMALAAVASLLAMPGCRLLGPSSAVSQVGMQNALNGRVVFPVARSTQATLGEVANAATVSLIDAQTGNTVSSSLTDASGSFVLTFGNFNPQVNSPYVLEAVKGLSVGGNANRAGASAARLRTYLFWNNGWQSLTNATQGVGIVVSAGTTALCALTSLKSTPAASLGLLVNTVNGGTGAFIDGSAGLSNANDYQPVLGLVGNAIALDQDPIAAIAYNSSNGTYFMATGVPVVTSVSPSIGTPGGNMILKGAYLDKLNGRNTFWFGTIAASTWSVSADRTQATVGIPSNAYSAPFTLQQPNGVVQTLNPFLMLHGTIGTLAGNGSASYVDGTGNAAEFNQPQGMAVDSHGNVYVSDRVNNCIRKVTPAGVVTTLAGSPTPGAANGVGALASFNSPQQIAVDAAGNVFVADWGNHLIRKITPSGVVSTYAGSTPGYLDGATSSAQFSGPIGVAVDAAGNVFVSDSNNARIREITPAGVVSTLAGQGTSAYLDGAGATAEFQNPGYLGTDSAGNLYVNDTYRIRKVTPGGWVSTLAGTGVANYVDGATSSAQFSRTSGGVADSSGNVYVSDMDNNVIRKIAGGVVSTFAGSTQGSANGSLLAAQFYNPGAIAFDPLGNLYLADRRNHRIQVITP